jgi:hypothetical protein
VARWFQYQVKTEPVNVPTVAAATIFVASVISEVIFPRSFIYQAKAEPLVVSEAVTVDKWHKPLSEPFRVKPRLPESEQQSLAFSPFPLPPSPSIGGVQSQSSVRIQSEYRFQYQASARPVVFQAPEVTTPDKWFRLWTDPTRRLSTYTGQQQALAYCEPPRPIISNRTPQIGPSDGGTSVLFTGKNFHDATAVMFGAFNAASFVVNSETSITAITSAQPANFVDTTVTTPFGTSTTGAFDTFTFYDVSPDMWFNPLSEPVRVKLGLRATQQQAYAKPVLPPTAEVITVDKWFESWVNPVRYKVGLATKLQQTLSWSTFTPQVTVTPAVTPATISSDVIFPRSFIYQSHTEPARKPDAVVTVPTYFNLVEGDSGVVFQKTLIYQISAEVSLTVNAIGWLDPLNEPVKVKLGLGAYQQQTLAWGVTTPAVTPPTPAVAPSTYSSEVSFPRSFIYQSHAEPASKPIIPATSWYGPLSEPVRAKPKLHTSQQQSLAWSAFTPATVVSFTYFPMVEGDSGVVFQKTIIYQISAEVSLTVNAIGWWEPLNEPVRIKQGLKAHQQQTLAWGVTTPVVTPPAVPAVTPSSYSSDVIFQRSFIYQAHAEPTRLPTAEIITLDKWYAPFRDPVRVKAGLPASEQQNPALVQLIPNPSTFLEGWQYQWSEPVRLKRFPTAEQRPFDIGLPSFEIITLDKWYAPFREPVRIKLGLLASEQQFLAIDPTFIPNPSKLLEGYLYPLSEPVRTRYLATAQQQVLAWNTLFAFEVITEDKWHQPWTIPVRIKPRLPEGEQQSFAFYTNPVITFGYYGWLSEPVRLKKGLRTDLQQTTTADTTVIPTSKIPNWLYPWSEPVRQKPGLKAGLQQATAPTAPIYPILSRLIQWFKPFDEPVREKRGFKAWLQTFFTAGTKPIAAQVSIVLDATETNKDVALFGVVVYNKVVSCEVSIKEKHRHHHEATSIAVVTTPVGTVTPVPDNAYVAEDGTTSYVAEDGITAYVQET